MYRKLKENHEPCVILKTERQSERFIGFNLGIDRKVIETVFKMKNVYLVSKDGIVTSPDAIKIGCTYTVRGDSNKT